ncbi:MAG: response regulator [Roseovarius sp.]|nr:response regulator [Roseovarius sp.]
MRGRDGLEIVRDLRRNTGAGIIVLGRSNDEIDVALALEMGADDYVGRPIRPRELCARIRTLLQRIVAPRSRPAARARCPIRRCAGWAIWRFSASSARSGSAGSW